MVDVREVIAAAIPCNIVYGRPQAADGIISALHAAGYRIIGPDEVDQVTLEKCAEIALRHVSQTDYDLEPEAAVAENVTAKMIASAIRAIGRKA